VRGGDDAEFVLSAGGFHPRYLRPAGVPALQRLQLDHIDVLYVHGFDPKTPVEEIMRSLNDIVLTGKVRYVAVCNWPAWLVMKALGIAEKHGWNKFVGMQYFYSVSLF